MVDGRTPDELERYGVAHGGVATARVRTHVAFGDDSLRICL
jgi:hypothetical protein